MTNNTTFKLYTDTGLTTPVSSPITILHNTSLSDNPQDFVYYFGSNGTVDPVSSDPIDTLLQASSNPGVDNITLTPTYILPEWAVATAYSLGDSVEPTSPNTYRYSCTTAGTSHATTEPTWPTTIGSTVADGTAVWTCVSKRHPNTEIKLALTSGGLAGATGGAALSLGAEIQSGTSNYVEVNMRITNTVTTISNNTGNAELALVINACREVEDV